MTRREFLVAGSSAAAALTLGRPTTTLGSAVPQQKPLFLISLAEWSLHRTIRDQKTMTNLDFPKVAKRDFGVSAVEYVNQFFMDKAMDQAYLKELKTICEGEGIKSVLIMCDGEGNLGDASAAKRLQAVNNHHKWADAAKFLVCHSIRVNAATGGVGSFE